MEVLNWSQATDHLVSLDFRLWATPGSSICVILSKVDHWITSLLALASPFVSRCVCVCVCVRACVRCVSTLRDCFLTYDQSPGESCLAYVFVPN